MKSSSCRAGTSERGNCRSQPAPMSIRIVVRPAAVPTRASLATKRTSTGHLVVRAALPASTPPILPSTKHPGAATWWSYARSRVRTVVDLVAVQTKDFRATRRTSIGLLAARAAVPASIRLILQSTRPHGTATFLAGARSRVRTVATQVAVKTRAFSATRRTSIGLPAGRAVSLVSIPTTRPSIRRPGPAMSSVMARVLGHLLRPKRGRLVPERWAPAWPGCTR